MSFREVPIGAAFDVLNGATPASGEESYWDGNIPWVTPVDLGGLSGREIAEGSRAITPKGYASCGTQMVPAGSIILSIRAPVGHMAIAKKAMCFNQGCRGLIPRRIIQTDFAYWALLARRPQLEAAGQGTTFIELGRGKLRAERVPVPDLITQQTIADFLDRETARIDQLIEKKERQVVLLAERKGAQASQFVTQGLNPHVTTFSTGIPWLPEAPSHWRVRRIATLFHEVDERGNDVLPVLSVSINWEISDRELEDEDRHRIVNHIADRTSYKRVRGGDLVYNMMRAWQGAFGVATVDGLVESRICRRAPERKYPLTIFRAAVTYSHVYRGI